MFPRVLLGVWPRNEAGGSIGLGNWSGLSLRASKSSLINSLVKISRLNFWARLHTCSIALSSPPNVERNTLIVVLHQCKYMITLLLTDMQCKVTRKRFSQQNIFRHKDLRKKDTTKNGKRTRYQGTYAGDFKGQDNKTRNPECPTMAVSRYHSQEISGAKHQEQPFKYSNKGKKD